MNSSKHKFDDDSNDDDLIPLKYAKIKKNKKANGKILKRDVRGRVEKKNEREVKEEDEKEAEGSFSFAELPHEILLLIFERLNMKEICQMAR